MCKLRFEKGKVYLFLSAVISGTITLLANIYFLMELLQRCTCRFYGQCSLISLNLVLLGIIVSMGVVSFVYSVHKLNNYNAKDEREQEKEVEGGSVL